jgi:hypothetical protein
MSKAAELAALIGSGQAQGDKNLIINGAMAISQRGTSAVTVTGSAGYRCVDRFKTDIDGSGGGDFSHAQATDTPSGQGFQYSSKITTVTQASQPASEGNRHQLYSLLEEQNVFHLEWGTSSAKTCTLSFWVKSSVTGTYGFIFGHYGSGSTYFYYTNYTIDSANTWEKKTITVTGPTLGGNNTGDNSFGVRVEWILGVGSDAETGTLNEWTTSSTMRTAANTVYLPENSGATWYITGVSLEIGEVATPFEHEPFAVTKHKCQRYYQRAGSYSGFFTNTTGRVRGVLVGETGMRAQPTASNTTGIAVYYKNAGISGATTIFTAPGNFRNGPASFIDFDTVASSTVQGQGCAGDNNTDVRYFELDAEL